MNGTLKTDQQLCKAFLLTASTAFRSVGITGLNHRLEDYYHTHRDTWDNLNREGLENCYRATLQMFHTMENKSI